METYTQLINGLRDCLRETQQRRSYMRISTEQETQRLEALLVAVRQMESDSKQSSSPTPLLSELLEEEWNKLLRGVGSRDLTVEESMSEVAMRRLTRYFKVRGQ